MLQLTDLTCRGGQGVIEVPTEDDQRIPLSCAACVIARGSADACGCCRQAAHHQLRLHLPGSFIGLHNAEGVLTKKSSDASTCMGASKEAASSCIIVSMGM